MRAMSLPPQTAPLLQAPSQKPGPVSHTREPSGSVRGARAFLQWRSGWLDSDWGTPRLRRADRAAAACVHQEKSLLSFAPSGTSMHAFDHGAKLTAVGITVCH